MSPDPIGFWGEDPNLYGYVGRDPISWEDPFGLGRDKILKDPSQDIWKSGFGGGGGPRTSNG